MKILIATKNGAKAGDYKNILTSFGIPTITLKELNDNDDVEEAGNSLKENAKIKALYFAKKYHMPAIADDSGFEIDALGGEPGIYARRWPGYEATDQELRDMVINKLQNIPLNKRTAKFTNVTVLANDKGEMVANGTGYIDGYIPLEISPKKIEGFPYRSVLFVTQFNKFWCDLTEEEFRQLNFRYKAVESIIPQIKNLLK